MVYGGGARERPRVRERVLSGCEPNSETTTTELENYSKLVPRGVKVKRNSGGLIHGRDEWCRVTRGSRPGRGGSASDSAEVVWEVGGCYF